MVCRSYEVRLELPRILPVNLTVAWKSNRSPGSSSPGAKRSWLTSLLMTQKVRQISRILP